MTQVTPRYWKSIDRWVVKTTGKGVVRLADGKGDVRKFRTKQEAEDACALINAAQATGGVITDATSGTFAAAIDLFDAYTNGRVDKKTITPAHANNLKTNARDWINRTVGDDAFGTLKINKITVTEIEFMLDQFDVAHKTKKEKLGALKQVFDLAHKNKWCAAINPARQVKLEAPRYDMSEEEAEQGGVIERFDVAEIAKLIEVALEADADWCDGLAVSFAAQTGLRFGEQAALKWKFLNLETGQVHVVVALRKGADGHMIEAGLPKTSKARRTVFLTPELVSALRQWKMRSPYSGDNDRVFATRAGTWQTSSDNWRKRVLHAACATIEMEPIRWHDLRHFFASLCVQLFDPSIDADHAAWKTIATYMGHKSDRTTRNLYVHWIDDPERDAAIGARFSEKLWGSK